jgi:mannose-6-phosphate isomerase
VRLVDKPWGKEEIWAETDKYLGKFLYIKAGEMLSRQYHEVKEETICVLEGTLVLEVGMPDEIGFSRQQLPPGQTFHVKPKTTHRFCATTTSVKLVEVSTPEIDDVVRLEDKYSRVALDNE